MIPLSVPMMALVLALAPQAERPLSAPNSPATQGDPNAAPTAPAGVNPIAPERTAPDGNPTTPATPGEAGAAAISKDRSTEAPGGQAESSGNGTLSTPAAPAGSRSEPEPRPSTSDTNPDRP